MDENIREEIEEALLNEDKIAGFIKSEDFQFQDVINQEKLDKVDFYKEDFDKIAKFINDSIGEKAGNNKIVEVEDDISKKIKGKIVKDGDIKKIPLYFSSKNELKLSKDENDETINIEVINPWDYIHMCTENTLYYYSGNSFLFKIRPNIFINSIGMGIHTYSIDKEELTKNMIFGGNLKDYINKIVELAESPNMKCDAQKLDKILGKINLPTAMLLRGMVGEIARDSTFHKDNYLTIDTYLENKCNQIREERGLDNKIRYMVEEPER